MKCVTKIMLTIIPCIITINSCASQLSPDDAWVKTVHGIDRQTQDTIRQATDSLKIAAGSMKIHVAISTENSIRFASVGTVLMSTASILHSKEINAKIATALSAGLVGLCGARRLGNYIDASDFFSPQRLLKNNAGAHAQVSDSEQKQAE